MTVNILNLFVDHFTRLPQGKALIFIYEGTNLDFKSKYKNAQERGILFLGPGVKVYAGMIVGMNSKTADIEVNVCKKKQLTNMRAAGSDENLHLSPISKTIKIAKYKKDYLPYFSDPLFADFKKLKEYQKEQAAKKQKEQD